MKIRLLDADEREDVVEFWQTGYMCQALCYNGTWEEKLATGRATCRVCGEKIKKGVKEVEFCYDEEGNPWTAKYYHIHAEPCIVREV